jgi:hypothetical protein
VGVVGRIVLLCESIEEGGGGRHILHVTFAATVAPGELRPGYDRRLVDAAWVDAARLAELPLFPAIGAELLQCYEERFAGPVRYLGNVWRDIPADAPGADD